MNKYYIIIAILFSISCSHVANLNLRSSYDFERSIKHESNRKYNYKFTISEETKRFKYATKPSGFIGGAADYYFNIGELFTAIIEQSENDKPNLKDKKIELAISKYKMKFTFGGSALVGNSKQVVDYAKIEMEITAKNESNVKIYSYKDEIDLSYDKSISQPEMYGAVNIVLEKIILKLLDDINKDLAGVNS